MLHRFSPRDALACFSLARLRQTCSSPRAPSRGRGRAGSLDQRRLARFEAESRDPANSRTRPQSRLRAGRRARRRRSGAPRRGRWGGHQASAGGERSLDRGDSLGACGNSPAAAPLPPVALAALRRVDSGDPHRRRIGGVPCGTHRPETSVRPRLKREVRARFGRARPSRPWHAAIGTASDATRNVRGAHGTISLSASQRIRDRGARNAHSPLGPSLAAFSTPTMSASLPPPSHVPATLESDRTDLPSLRRAGFDAATFNHGREIGRAHV